MTKHRDLGRSVEEAMISFERLVAVRSEPDVLALGRARVVLVQRVNVYIAHLGLLIREKRDLENLCAWRQAYADLVELRGRYSEHIALFSPASTQANWQAYQESSRGLIMAMQAHIKEVSAWKPID